MKIEISACLSKDSKGIGELLKLIGKKEKLTMDFKRGKISLDNFPIEKIDFLLSIISNFFDITSLEVNNEKKYKIRNDEKDLQSKKQKIAEAIKKKPTTIVSKVHAYVLKEKVFTLTQLREAFPEANYATLRGYVNDMKKDNILIELERGKYSIR